MTRTGLLGSPARASAVGIASGAALVAAVFLPWYQGNLGAPTVPGGRSGWESTTVAKGVFVLALVALVAALVIAADVADVVPLERRTAESLAWLLVASSIVAGVLIGYRLARPPGPAEFLSRDIGLFLGVAAAVGGAVAGLAQLARRE
ncbi:MAG TPA: hypothetical protein VKD47_08630 [Miltoncostaeaceae bacterium]|nr:hypothetical protein [Miltoncostaeaceae bacterium]